MHWKIPNLFDCWANAVVRLFLLESLELVFNVTRLGEFLKFSRIKIPTKVAKMFANF